MRKMRIVTEILVCACIFFLATPVPAQEKDTITVSTEIVNVSVAVNDRDGKSIGNLSKSDFELFDNGKEAEIAFFSGHDAPVSYGIVYDLHPTTAVQTKAILRALEAFTNGLGQNEDFFLTIFNEYGSLNVNFVPSEDQIRRHLSFGERNEPNSLYDSVYYAGNKLRGRANQKRTLIIISDGKDHQSHHSFKELKRLFDSFSIQIYAVILDEKDVWVFDDLSGGDTADRLRIEDSALDKAAIRSLSKETGGKVSSSLSQNSVDVYKIFESIALEMRDRYSLGFYPLEGNKHELEIRLKSKKGENRSLSYKKTINFPEQR